MVSFVRSFVRLFVRSFPRSFVTLSFRFLVLSFIFRSSLCHFSFAFCPVVTRSFRFSSSFVPSSLGPFSLRLFVSSSLRLFVSSSPWPFDPASPLPFSSSLVPSSLGPFSLRLFVSSSLRVFVALAF